MSFYHILSDLIRLPICIISFLIPLFILFQYQSTSRKVFRPSDSQLRKSLKNLVPPSGAANHRIIGLNILFHIMDIRSFRTEKINLLPRIRDDLLIMCIP